MQLNFATSSLKLIVLLLICIGCNSKSISESLPPTSTQANYSSSSTPTVTLITTSESTSSLSPTYTLTPTPAPVPPTPTPTNVSESVNTFHCDEIADISLSDDESGWAVVNCTASVGNRAPSGGYIYRLQNDNWQVVTDAPKLPGSYACYEGISAISTNEIWAIGLTEGVYVCQEGNWLIHYVKGQWEVVDIKNLFNSLSSYHRTGLHSIEMVDSENGWMGGKGVIFRYKDGKWFTELELPSSEDSGFVNIFYSISMSSSNEGWTWAWKREGGAFFRYENNAWKRWKDLIFEGGIVVRGIDAVNADEAWAVGYRETTDNVPMLWHYTDERWTEVELPIKIGALQSIKMVNENEGWATGGMWNRNAVVLHYINGQWQNVPKPTEASILSVDVTNSGNVWMGAEKFYKYSPSGEWQAKDVESIVE